MWKTHIDAIMVVDKHITVHERHAEFIDDEHLSLSEFVREQLDEEMNRRRRTRR